MTPAQAAARLHLNQYQLEGNEVLFREMEAHGLVAVYGGHNDFVVLQGAITDEADAGVIMLDQSGIIENPCEDHDCPAFAAQGKTASRFICTYHPPHSNPDGFIFTYQTTLPRADFNILDEGKPYCRGFVFALADVAGVYPAHDHADFLEKGFAAIERLIGPRGQIGSGATAARILGVVADLRSGCSLYAPNRQAPRRAA